MFKDNIHEFLDRLQQHEQVLATKPDTLSDKQAILTVVAAVPYANGFVQEQRQVIVWEIGNETNWGYLA